MAVPRFLKSNVVTAPKGYGGNPFAPNPNQSDELLPYALKLFIENGQAITLTREEIANILAASDAI